MLSGISRFLILMLALGLCNCTTAYYMPALHNIPLLQQEGDFIYSGGSSISENDNIMIENNFTYGISDSIALTFGSGVTITPINLGHYVTIGAGYFKPVNARKTLIFETYAGVGHHGIYIDNSTSNLWKLYIQPDFGFRHKIVEVALASRFTAMYADPSNQIRANMQEMNIRQNSHLNKGMYYFFEPGVALRLGYKYVKIHSQAGWAASLSSKPMAYDRININLGFSVRFPYNKF